MSGSPSWKNSLNDFLVGIGDMGSFTASIFRNFVRHGVNFKEFSTQCYRVGNKSLPLIVAGKVGSGIGAELASMRVTEQLDAMEVSGANPISFVVTTRVLAITLMFTTPFIIC